MPKLNYYGVVPTGNGSFTVYAIDPEAQQNFFGWGSDHNAIDMAFYGDDAKDVPVKLKGRLAPGDRPWKWTLGPEHARVMLGHIEKNGKDLNYYTAAAQRRLPDLVEVLKFIVK